ncbi:MAG: cupin domain-containing protein [Phycisphaerales bacterium]
MTVAPAGNPDPIIETLNVLGHPTQLLLTAEQTRGALSLVRITIPPYWGNPVHTHWFEDETFYILSGTLDVTVNNHTTRLTEGQAAFGPKLVPHAFANPTDKPATALVFATPGGIERFFRACNAAFPEGATVDPAIATDIISRHAMTLADPHETPEVAPTAGT